eukprot:m.21665 g.21665  ORF g.21665 m.21665 type:complete len:253 (-) comp3941_c0_seq1:20-778(-)
MPRKTAPPSERCSPVTGPQSVSTVTSAPRASVASSASSTTSGVREIAMDQAMNVHNSTGPMVFARIARFTWRSGPIWPSGPALHLAASRSCTRMGTTATSGEERAQMLGAVYLVLRDQSGRLLLSQRQNTGWMDGHWTLVSGHVESGEGLSEAMAREAREEAGLVIAPLDLEILCCLHRRSGERTYFDFFLEPRAEASVSGRLQNLEPSKCSALDYFPRHELPSSLVPHIAHALDCIDQHRPFSQFGTLSDK